MENFLGFDPVELVTNAYAAYETEQERWETLTSSDDSTESKGTDVRTLVKTTAAAFTADESHTGIRETLSALVSEILDSEESDGLCWLAGVFATATAAVNDAAKYSVRQTRPDVTDVDSDQAECYATLKTMRDSVNMGLGALKLIGQSPTVTDVETKGKGKGTRTSGTVTVGDVTLKVRVGGDGSLTLASRLPNDPSEGKSVGRPVQTSKLSFKINGENFVPRQGVATVHLAHEINRLGGNVPVTTDEFLSAVQAVNGNVDFFKAPWQATFGPVKVECSKAE
jgi:hypothetical protein